MRHMSQCSVTGKMMRHDGFLFRTFCTHTPTQACTHRRQIYTTLLALSETQCNCLQGHFALSLFVAVLWPLQEKKYNDKSLGAMRLHIHISHPQSGWVNAASVNAEYKNFKHTVSWERSLRSPGIWSLSESAVLFPARRTPSLSLPLSLQVRHTTSADRKLHICVWMKDYGFMTTAAARHGRETGCYPAGPQPEPGHTRVRLSVSA